MTVRLQRIEALEAVETALASLASSRTVGSALAALLEADEQPIATIASWEAAPVGSVYPRDPFIVRAKTSTRSVPDCAGVR